MRLLRTTTSTLLVCAALALTGCSAMQAQNPSSALRPVNAIADAQGERVMLGGHDVVAYFTLGRHALGDPRWVSQYEGVDFRFASAEHKILFDAEPRKYLPQYGGYCTNGIAYGIPWGGDPDVWKMIDGKLYIFGGRASMDAFMLDAKRNLMLAEKYWTEEVAGSNSFVQRFKRLVFRVPHYKSGDELAQEVAQARARGG